MNKEEFTWNRELILGGKTYGINDSKKEIRNIYKTKEEQEKDDEIEYFEAIEATESGEGRFFKNPYWITQEELVNWAFYGKEMPVQDFEIAFNTIENVPLMVDLVEQGESVVKDFILFVLYDINSWYKTDWDKQDPTYQQLKEIVNQLDKQNRTDIIKKWIDDFERVD